ncbi:MAG: hypothetical protein US41_C0008G0010, partial [Parcubacteria group bacterium GW2011_GWB1_37_13]
ADKNNIYIGKREGSTYIPPSGSFAIFEPGIDIGNSVPVYTTFEFTQIPEWIQVSQEKINQLQVLVSDINLTDEATMPRLFATIKNNSFFVIPEIDVVAILYDANHNAISASRTYLDQLVFEEITKEIIPMYNIFLVQLK